MISFIKLSVIAAIATAACVEAAMENITATVHRYTGEESGFKSNGTTFTISGNGTGDVFAIKDFSYDASLNEFEVGTVNKISFSIPERSGVNFYIAGKVGGDYTRIEYPGVGMVINAKEGSFFFVGASTVDLVNDVVYVQTAKIVDGYLNGTVAFSYNQDYTISVGIAFAGSFTSYPSILHVSGKFEEHLGGKWGFIYENRSDKDMIIDNFSFEIKQGSTKAQYLLTGNGTSFAADDNSGDSNGSNDNKPKDAAMSSKSLSAVFIATVAILSTIALIA